MEQIYKACFYNEPKGSNLSDLQPLHQMIDLRMSHSRNGPAHQSNHS